MMRQQRSTRYAPPTNATRRRHARSPASTSTRRSCSGGSCVSSASSQRLRIVVLGYIVRCPLGGLAWHHLQYVMGLRDLGHDVHFIEDSDDTPWCCYDPRTHITAADPTYGL